MSEKPSVTPEFMTEAECAQFLGMSAVWLRKRRDAGKGPPHYRLGRNAIRYRRDEVLDWMKNYEVAA